MDSSKLVYSFFLFFINFYFSSSSSMNNIIHRCPDEQRDALLLFKQNISSTDESDHSMDRYCDDDLYGHMSYGPFSGIMSWNTSRDCCDWDGISCHNSTGDIISLDLKCRRLQGLSELDIVLSSLPNLERIDLSYNSDLSVVIRNDGHYANPYLLGLRLASCKLTVFPNFLRAMKHLRVLDLSKNYITGSFPPWICNMKHLETLDTSYNSITGVLPQCLKNISSSLVTFNVQSNMIQGPFPTAICNMGSLLYLYMWNNNFHGVIPECFGNITSSLALIDLGGNSFHGTIPKVYGDCEIVEVLLLHGNKLDGEVPSSLSKCKSLKLLDLGDNQLNGTFPRWLGDLPKLQALILKSNNLHGTIEASSTPGFLFPSLHVFDISNNDFVGRLPQQYFESFDAIKDVDTGPRTHFLNYSTTLDLSSNRFDGQIPDAIGNLKSLKRLNLSNNNLNGQIPPALGFIRDMEALDLSRNQLHGKIPQSLVHLTYLAILNLSQNHLVGRIPEGALFSTFGEDSYLGNPRLCGPPLHRHCEDLSSIQVEAEGEEWIDYMKPGMLGLGCGTLLGLVLGYRMLSTEKPKWFTAIADTGGHVVHRRRKKKKRTYTRN